VFWLDRPGIVSDLRKAVDELVERCPEIERVVLFGSMARGDAVPGSDADLLVVLRQSDLPFIERGARYYLSGLGVGVDVLAYTQDELSRMLDERNPFVTHALKEGIALYDHAYNP